MAYPVDSQSFEIAPQVEAAELVDSQPQVEEEILKVIKLDKTVVNSDGECQSGSLPTSKRDSVINSSLKVEISETNVSVAQAKDIVKDNRIKVDLMFKKSATNTNMLTLSNENFYLKGISAKNLPADEAKKAIIKNLVLQRRKKFTTENEQTNNIKKKKWSNKHEQKLKLIETPEQKALRENCVCNALNNLAICRCNSTLFYYRRGVQKVTTCYCAKSYTKGNDGFAYHTICCCFANK